VLKACGFAPVITRKRASQETKMRKTINMKHYLLIAGLLLFSSLQASAQLLTAESFNKINIDKYDGRSDKKHQYVPAADNLKSYFEIDKNNQLSSIQVIELAGMDKDKIYDNINAWFTKAFSDKLSSIKTNNKESGQMIVNTVLKNIVKFPHQIVSVDMTTRIDVKDGKIRLTNIINKYLINAGTEWSAKKCYPFIDEQDELRKKVGSSGYVTACVYVDIVTEQIKEAAKPKATQKTDDDW